MARTAAGAPILVSADRVSLAGAGFSFVNAKATAVAHLEKPLGSHSHYFSRGRSVAGVPHYGQLRFRDVYPSVDLVYYARDGQLEYDFLLRPHADPNRIRLRFDRAPVLLENDDLQIGSGAVLRKPVATQGSNSVTARYKVSGREAGIELGPYDVTQPLTIDPVLTYSIPFELLGNTTAQLTADANGTAYLAGVTLAADFPQWSVPQWSQARTSLLVARFNAAGTLLSTTYIGGVSAVSSIMLDPPGNIYVSGDRFTEDFPLVSPPASPSPALGYLIKLPNAANAISVSTLTGKHWTIDRYRQDLSQLVLAYRGSGLSPSEVAYASAATLALVSTTAIQFPEQSHRMLPVTDAAGNIYVGGSITAGETFTTTPGVFQPTHGGASDVYLAKLAPNGTTVTWATYLGGSNFDTLFGLKVDASGAVYAFGATGSANFPVTPGAARTASAGLGDGFVARVCPDATCLSYATYLGGSRDDAVGSLILTGTGQAIVGGWTQSADFPVVNAVQPQAANPGELMYRAGANVENLPAPWMGWEQPHLSIRPGNSNELLWAGLGGIHRSVDGGQNWVSVLAQQVATMFRSPADPQVVYAVAGTTVYRSGDGGATFTAPGGFFLMDGLTLKAVGDPLDANRFYLASGQSFGFSGNGGQTVPTVRTAGIVDLAVSTGTGTVLYRAGWGVEVLTNGLNSSTTVTLPVEIGAPRSIAAHPSNPAVFYVAGYSKLGRTTPVAGPVDFEPRERFAGGGGTRSGIGAVVGRDTGN